MAFSQTGKGVNGGSYLLIRHLQQTSTCFTSWSGASKNPGSTLGYTVSYRGWFQNSPLSTWVQTCPDTRFSKYVNCWSPGTGCRRICHSAGPGGAMWAPRLAVVPRRHCWLSGSFYSALNVARLGEKWGRDLLVLLRFFHRIRSGLQQIQKAH